MLNIAPSAGEKDRYSPQIRCKTRKISVSVVSAIGGRNCITLKSINTFYGETILKYISNVQTVRVSTIRLINLYFYFEDIIYSVKQIYKNFEGILSDFRYVFVIFFYE